MPAEQNHFLRISPDDNLLVALQDLPKGTRIETSGNSFILPSEVPAKHKFTETSLACGTQLKLYGVLVAETTKAIEQGERITTQNVVHRSESYRMSEGEFSWSAPQTETWNNRTFDGYHRSDGSVGTANFWLVVPMVFCENGNIETLKSSMLRALGLSKRNQYEIFSQSLARDWEKISY